MIVALTRQSGHLLEMHSNRASLRLTRLSGMIGRSEQTFPLRMAPETRSRAQCPAPGSSTLTRVSPSPGRPEFRSLASGGCHRRQ